MYDKIPLLIPHQYKTWDEDLSSEWSLRKYYLSEENKRYVKAQIIYMVRELETENGDPNESTHPVTDLLTSLCPRRRAEALAFVDLFMNQQAIFPDRSSLKSQLHELNKTTIYETASQIVMEPSMIDQEWDRRGGVTFKEENLADGPQYGQYNYTTYSFRGGQWHPEDLFLESDANRRQTYWEPTCVKFDPMERGPGNKWTTMTDPFYNSQRQRFNQVNDPPGYERRSNINPYQVLTTRHYAAPERNCEDRRVEVPRRIQY